MAVNELEFVPVNLPEMSLELEEFVNDLQEKDKKEVELCSQPDETPYECVHNVLLSCIDRFFVVYNEEIIGLVAHRPVMKDGYDIAVMCVLTSNKVKKYHKQYVLAAKRFVSSLAANYDAIVCEILDGYTSSLNMAKKLGFQKAAVYERNGGKFIVEVLRISHGLDSERK